MATCSGPGRSDDRAADRSVLLLQKVSELLLESRAIAQELEVVPDRESSADAADRIAYGILVAALEEGLVSTIGTRWTNSSDSVRRRGYSGNSGSASKRGSLSRMDRSSILRPRAHRLGIRENIGGTTNHEETAVARRTRSLPWPHSDCPLS